MLGTAHSGIPVLHESGDRRRRYVVRVVALVALGLVIGLITGFRSGADTRVLGAGSTAAQPLVEGAAVRYRNARSADNPALPDRTGGDWSMDGSGVDYEPIGSLGGINRVSDDRSGITFAVSDYPLSHRSLDRHNLAQFPVAIGSLAVVHNLDLPAGRQLTLDAPALARIYRGEIANWDDPAIAALNPELRLPTEAIVPVHRSEGSGSTFGFTAYLATAVGVWDAGSGSLITWPQGIGRTAERTSAMVSTVQDSPGAIGYVETGQATRAGLAVAALQNAAGRATLPEPESMRASVTGADWSGEDDYVNPIAGADVPDAYPMTVAIYAALSKDSSRPVETRRALSFLEFIMTNYDADAAALGYVPLSQTGSEQIVAYWDTTFAFAR